ncbi:nitrous oxide-stimulated promoter family protein [Xanthobacteraceae bacterium Astr-EGSB]|uniref:nitrous oxide-stimulated promoter family protein n=1 Tax=Astrobacterium formosum TaxID=3069710 RepID=UPI0027B84309|nr:nitrous oxide-stimulated promoter family protein [Xanthobacteraceae bacterium Astr-EGSB]
MVSTGHSSENREQKPFVRRARALKTIDAMIGMYCRGHHHGELPLCPDCERLRNYAARRLQRCVFGDDKPNCADCVVHCYRTEMRERIRAVMRWAGPRMALRHPILTIAHMLAERRPVPSLPLPPRRAAGDSPPAAP